MTVLSIGATHPWHAAGAGLDLLVGAELGMRTLTVLTAVTAQDAHGVHGVEPLSPSSVRAQVDSIPLSTISAVRVGMLGAPENAAVVAETLQRLYDVPAVVDPVASASLGGELSSPETFDALRERIASLPTVILTPNIHEASMLLDGRAIDRDGIAQAARDLVRLGMRAALVKGGHLDGSPADALATHESVEVFTSQRVDADMRGTGCVLAMALACALAQGDPLRDAVQFARAFVRRKIGNAGEFRGVPMAY